MRLSESSHVAGSSTTALAIHLLQADVSGQRATHKPRPLNPRADHLSFQVPPSSLLLCCLMFGPEDPKLIAVPLMAPSSGAAIVSLQLIAAPTTSVAQSDSLSLVEERLNSLGVEYIKEHVVEGGIKITQMFFPRPRRQHD